MTSISPASAPLVTHFAPLAGAYDIALCDVWGVIHNGLVAFPAAGDALVRFREGGGTVVLVSNAPRPGEIVARQLDRLGVPRRAYDAIVTSGDVTRGLVAARAGVPVHHIGPSRDLPVFEGLEAPFAPVDEAGYVVCTGLLDDDTETPDDYAEALTAIRERGLLFICANPDRVVERGDRLVYCAGAIADAYVALGGETIYAGKPYPPIYEEALARAARLRGQETPRDRILAIGDSVRTDLSGAMRLGFDGLFVTQGIHAAELAGANGPDPEKLASLFTQSAVWPKAATAALRW